MERVEINIDEDLKRFKEIIERKFDERQIKNLTKYIDPVKFNEIFEIKSLEK